jgi:hypothetical protein
MRVRLVFVTLIPKWFGCPLLLYFLDCIKGSLRDYSWLQGCKAFLISKTLQSSSLV